MKLYKSLNIKDLKFKKISDDKHECNFMIEPILHVNYLIYKKSNNIYKLKITIIKGHKSFDLINTYTKSMMLGECEYKSIKEAINDANEFNYRTVACIFKELECSIKHMIEFSQYNGKANLDDIILYKKEIKKISEHLYSSINTNMKAEFDVCNYIDVNKVAENLYKLGYRNIMNLENNKKE